MSQCSQINRRPSSIIKGNHSYSTRIPRSRNSSIVCQEPPQPPLNGLQDNQHFWHYCHLFSSTTSSICNKWVINLSTKELTLKEKYLLQKGPNFAVTPATIPDKEYTSTTTLAALQDGDLNGVECSGLCHDDNRILKTYTTKSMHTNITTAEHLALEYLRKDKDHIIATTDKGVAIIVIDKIEYITKCEALLQDNSVYQHLSKDTSPTIHKKNSLKFCKITRITVSSQKQNTPY